ncbi:MAG: Na/Pi cotransporter family protein [Firmicutes bacterium]|nr:Na/Pi cotransporter family protein [Bacillota bacterium]
MSILDAFILLGGIGLFLYGMMIMSSGLRNACGDRLRVLLAKATQNKGKSVLAGILVTVLMQSSSATDVMVIGFVSSGMMTLMQALGVIMGANIGTTVTAQITAFNIGAYAPLILFAGVILNQFIKNSTVRHIGAIVLGFGMLFEGITLMKSVIAPLAQTESFINLISSLSNPALLVILGIVFTALLQSSSSSTVIFQAFAVQGIIDYRTAVYLIIGAAIGSVMPNLLAGLTSNRQGKRCALLNLLFNLMRAALILVLITIFPKALELIQSISPGNVARQIANTHTIFAVVAVLILLPFSGIIVKMTEKLIPTTEREKRQQEERQLIYLTRMNLVPTVVAIEQAHREVSRMGELAYENLSTAINCFFTHDSSLAEQVETTEETVDYLAHAIVDKLVELRAINMTPRQLNRLYRMIQVVDDIERISDHAENIIEYELQVRENKAHLSESGMEDLRNLSEMTKQSLRLSLNIFEQETFERIPQAHELEEKVDDMKDYIMEQHIVRLAKQECDPSGGIIFTDMAIDLERCSDHAFNIATALR